MPTEEQVKKKIEWLRARDEPRGYRFNPNANDLRTVVEGYMVNEERFGYPACPCRLPTGDRATDMDIICPCDYRDDDVAEHGACYCSLYVSDEVANGERPLGSVPERRRYDADGEPVVDRPKPAPAATGEGMGGLRVSVNVWRCPVCGYLAAKDGPPPKCPICGVGRERFELFIAAG